MWLSLFEVEDEVERVMKREQKNKKGTEGRMMPKLWTVVGHSLVQNEQLKHFCLESCSCCCVPRVMTEGTITDDKTSIARI